MQYAVEEIKAKASVLACHEPISLLEAAERLGRPSLCICCRCWLAHWQSVTSTSCILTVNVTACRSCCKEPMLDASLEQAISKCPVGQFHEALGCLQHTDFVHQIPRPAVAVIGLQVCLAGSFSVSFVCLIFQAGCLRFAIRCFYLLLATNGTLSQPAAVTITSLRVAALLPERAICVYAAKHREITQAWLPVQQLLVCKPAKA